MALLRSIRDGLRGLFRRRAVEAELDDEVQDYLAQATRERIRGGMTPESAARAARLELGSVAAVKEEARSGGWEANLESVGSDFRYAARSLRKNPGFTLVALLTLALGIGATTAIFSSVNAVILRPLPFRDADRLAVLWTDDVRRGLHEVETSFPTVRDWQAQTRTFAELAVFSFDNTVTLLGGDEPERTTSSFVSTRLFPLLGAEPLLGRGITAEDQQRREPVVVLSYGLWQRRFGGRRDVVGKFLSLDGDGTASKGGPRSVRVIGVMPPEFFFPGPGTQLWEPVTSYWRLQRESGDRFFNNWRVVGRLAPGASFSAAQVDMDAIGRRLAQAYPSPDPDFPGFGVTVVPLLDQVTGKNLQRALWVLLGAVGLVLLIACVNLASLQLARGAARGRELAVRVSLGAGRLRLLRQLLTESLTLAGIGGAAGLALAAAVVRVLAAAAPPGIARIDGMRVDGTVLAFMAGVSILAGILFGIVPAWTLSRSNPNDALKTGGPGASGTRRIRSLLVVAECALAVVLLIGAGLLIRSAVRLQAVDPGFDPDHVLLVRVAAAAVRGPAETVYGRRLAALATLTERLAGVHGVRDVGAVSSLLRRDNPDQFITVEGGAGGPGGGGTGQLASSSVDPGFFSTMRVPLRRGRLHSQGDAVAAVHLIVTSEAVDYAGPAEAAVVNQAFVQRFFPDRDPIGRRFYLGAPPKVYWYEIVGVVGDMHRQGLEKGVIPEYFGSNLGGSTDLVLRTDGNPLALAPAVRQEIRSVDRTLMILSVGTADRALGALSTARRFQTWLLAGFAAFALALAAVGLYGLLHYAVAQRTQEIGVRIALGARAPDVIGLVLGEGMALAAGGIALGVAAALGVTRLMAYMLFEIGATDAATFTAVPLILAGVALVACYLPARRATQVDPLRALKTE